MNHEYLQDDFDTFAFFRANETRLVLLQSDAEAMLKDSATIITTSGVMAAAMLLEKWRIVRDDLPLETPLDLENEHRYKLFAIALGRYLSCLSLETKGQIERTEEGWKTTGSPSSKSLTLRELLDLEQFGDSRFTCDTESET